MTKGLTYKRRKPFLPGKRKRGPRRKGSNDSRRPGDPEFGEGLNKVGPGGLPREVLPFPSLSAGGWGWGGGREPRPSSRVRGETVEDGPRKTKEGRRNLEVLRKRIDGAGI